ncbi:hypothetical protein BC830DRAFT_1226048 [Chytriomyces sp. MP71]|nr:hypothetical protein BC830DRAFT_1226048 [Chytriomyces sp. MP71]
MHSIVCAYYVGLGFAFGATGSSTPCNAITPRPFSLCASTFDAFSSSWDSIMNDRTICPSGVSVDSLNYKSLLLTSKALASTDAACVAGVLEENIECGFQTVGEAMAFCANVANAATNACCAQFLPSTTVVPAMDIATKALPMTSLTLSTRVVALTAAIATTTATISNSPSNGSINIAPHTIADGTAVNQESPSTESSNSRNLLVGIITGVAGAIVTVLATVVVLYFRRTRAKRASEVPSVGYKLSKIMINGTLTRLNKSVLPVAEAPQHGETLTALSDFDPQLPDEIQVTRHDKIIVDHVFDDLWATGFNHRTIENGVFPLAVFSPPAYERLFAKRVSSIDRSRKSVPPPVPPKDVIEPTVPKQHETKPASLYCHIQFHCRTSG